MVAEGYENVGTSFYNSGETAHNKDNVIQGQMDVPLSQTGLHQAELLGIHLQNQQYSHVYAIAVKAPLNRPNSQAVQLAVINDSSTCDESGDRVGEGRVGMWGDVMVPYTITSVWVAVYSKGRLYSVGVPFLLSTTALQLELMMSECPWNTRSLCDGHHESNYSSARLLALVDIPPIVGLSS
ncbi:hypothetical protein TNCV_5005001 [Trichonephila clavipes]|uniref:Uncharacterized protein n=1 Tax=Trichonephila clavipes TaxID=2585209 RepID=A0A8X6RBG8_TRICX|nr:hypothetical protein TNCV_5005001 [Trichonephila clavipes]